MSGSLSVWLSPGLAKVKAKFISRMRGSQSDPTHTYAPVCPRVCPRYARVNAGGARGRARLREYHAAFARGERMALHRFGAA